MSETTQELFIVMWRNLFTGGNSPWRLSSPSVDPRLQGLFGSEALAQAAIDALPDSEHHKERLFVRKFTALESLTA